MEYKYYLVYRITNVLNGKYYIGKHCTNDMRDSYMGSGKLIQKAIKKHGLENFKKEILVSCDNEFDMNVIESCLVVPFPDNKLSYNLQTGGRGGFSYINANGLAFTKKSRKKQKIGCKNYWNTPGVREKKSKEKKDYFAKYGAANYSAATKKKWENPEYREKMKVKMAEINSGLDKRIDAGKKIRDKWQTDEEFIGKMRKRKPRGPDGSKMKQLWKDPEWRNKMILARNKSKKQDKKEIS